MLIRKSVLCFLTLIIAAGWPKAAEANYPVLDSRCPEEQFQRYVSSLEETASAIASSSSEYGSNGYGQLEFSINALSLCGERSVPILLEILDKYPSVVVDNILYATMGMGSKASSASSAIFEVLKSKEINLFSKLQAARALLSIGADPEKISSEVIFILEAGGLSEEFYSIGFLEILRINHEGNYSTGKLIDFIEQGDGYLTLESSLAIGLSPEIDSGLIVRLLSLLKTESNYQGVGSAFALAAFQDYSEISVPHLERALYDSKGIVNKIGAMTAILSLGAITQDHIDHYFRFMISPHDEENWLYASDDLRFLDEFLIQYLAHKTEPLLPEIIAAIRKENTLNVDEDLFFEDQSRSRRAALEILSAMGDIASPSVESLIAIALDETDTSLVRESAIRALGNIGPKASSASPMLKELLKNDEFNSSAAEALAKMGEIEVAIPYLINLLYEEADNYLSFPCLYKFSCQVLTEIGSPSISFLLNDFFAQGNQSEKQLYLLEVLLEIAKSSEFTDRQTETLVSILNDEGLDFNIRRTSAYILDRIDIDVSGFYAANNLIPLEYITCPPEVVWQEYEIVEYVLNLVDQKCESVGKGNGGADLFYRIRNLFARR